LQINEVELDISLKELKRLLIQLTLDHNMRFPVLCAPPQQTIRDGDQQSQFPHAAAETDIQAGNHQSLGAAIAPHPRKDLTKMKASITRSDAFNS
jgi:hypothetical protein